MRYLIGDSARLVTPYRGYSWVTIIGYEGDGYCVELTSGLEIVVREDELEELLRRYFSEVLQTARWNHFDSLAHLTYPLRYIKKKLGLDVDTGLFKDQIDLILRTLAINGKALEVNSSGLRQELGKTLPGREVIERFKELGGKYVTVGSDAHCCEDLASGVGEAYALLRGCGFTHYTVYEKHRPVLFEL